MRWLIVACFSFFLITACTPVEKVAYRTVVASKAFLDSVKSKHPECFTRGIGGRGFVPTFSGTSTSTLCVDLTKATAAKDALIDAGEVYCGVATFGNDDKTPCHPVKSAEATLQNALANYTQAEKDLKAVIQ